MVERTIKRRVSFNLKNFLEELESCINGGGNGEDIDDLVQDFKRYLSRVKEKNPKLITPIVIYTDKHELVRNDKKLKSYLTACYKEFLC